MWINLKILFCESKIFLQHENILNYFYSFTNIATDQPLICEENQFKCMRRCIPISWRCDGDYDCIDEDDKTDEANCRKCDFLLELL